MLEVGIGEVELGVRDFFFCFVRGIGAGGLIGDFFFIIFVTMLKDFKFYNEGFVIIVSLCDVFINFYGIFYFW